MHPLAEEKQNVLVVSDKITEQPTESRNVLVVSDKNSEQPIESQQTRKVNWYP